MIPVLLPEHHHHERAVAALNQHLAAGDEMLIVGHTLLETYSSLTRMPPPSRLSSQDALLGLTSTFLSLGTVVSLRHNDYDRLLRELADTGTIGGQVYDAAIVACARLAGATVIVTFNERHFRRFEGNGLTIEVP